MPGPGVRVFEHEQSTRLGRSDVRGELLLGTAEGRDLEAGMGEVE